MKKISTTIISLAIALTVAVAVVIVIAAMPIRSLADVVVAPSLGVKLPYAKGQSFLVTQGYDTPPTHIKKDSYALDFTQNGCDAYGVPAVAAASGTAMFLSQEGYNGGYGTELIIDHGDHVVSRYAHMIPESITIAATGASIRRGQLIGFIGDTGLVAGAACAEHPGTHLHFAMDTVNSDGTFSAYDPEPISGYTNLTAGKWYLSDNGDDDNSNGVAGAASSVLRGKVLGVSAVATTTPVAATTTAAITTLTTSSSQIPPPPFTNSGVSAGNIIPAIVSGDASSTSTPASDTSSTDATGTDASTTATSTATTTIISTSTMGSSSSSITTATSSTQEDSSSTVASSTSSSTASSSDSGGASNPSLFAQFDDSVDSQSSWYDDNWFELGNGFSGTLNTLTLEGKVSDQLYYGSHVALQEFKDKNYTVMIQQFPISDNAPFTPVIATATFSGLSISLKPYFYYRLTTMQDFQNRSVILAGTATTTTGTMMWDNFIYGEGGVQFTEPFFPFMVMEGIAATSTLAPPLLTTPTNLAMQFDDLGMQLSLSFGTSTDPDWSANPLHYEMNYSTSTTLSDADWSALGSIPVAIGNSYLIGVRAEDSFGDVSAVVTTTWNFPPGFSPYHLSPELNYAYQYFTVPVTSTLQSIQLFTANFLTGARNPDVTGCSLELFDEYDLSSLGVIPSDNGFSGYSCAGTPIFNFTSSPFVLSPSHIYHWVFQDQTWNPSTAAVVQFYGTGVDAAGGLFSDPSLVNAKFVVTGDTGVLFSN